MVAVSQILIGWNS